MLTRRHLIMTAIAAALLGIVIFWPDGVYRPPAEEEPTPVDPLIQTESPTSDERPSNNIICYASGSSDGNTEMTCYLNGEQVEYADVMEELSTKGD